MEKNYLNKSYWKNEERHEEYPPLSDEGKFDVLIIGAGIAGLTTAYLLKDSGLKVGIIEATKIGLGTTGYSSAKITIQHGLKYDYLIKSFGKELAMQYLNSNNDAIGLIKSIVEKDNISCDYKTQSAYLYTTKSYEINELEKEIKAYEDLNIDALFVKDSELPFEIEGAIKLENQAQFHPLKYLYSLSDIVKDSGIHIYENTRAIDIKGDKSPFIIITNKGEIKSDIVVVASHYPFLKGYGMYFMRMHAEKSYMLALKTIDKPFDGMYINLSDPKYSMRYHYSEEDNILLLGGSNHKVGLKKDERESYLELETFSNAYFMTPQIISKWSTQDCMPLDKVPYIGQMTKDVPNLYVETGFGKWGMTSGTVAAQIIRDKIMNCDKKNGDIYNPQRFKFKESASELISNSLSSTGGLIKRVLTIPLRDVKDIRANEGKIVEYEGHKIGVYKDKNEKYLGIVPVCTHLGCQLKFNTAEKTWDCQCHGSRFDLKGHVIEGPAVKPLEKVIINKGDNDID